MSRRSPLAVATVAFLAIGLALMLPFEQTLPLLLGTVSLFAFIACGVFLIANPEDLGRDDDPSEPG